MNKTIAAFLLLALPATGAVAQDAMKHDQMSSMSSSQMKSGDHMKMSAADTRKMAACKKMTTARRAKDAKCGELMTMHSGSMKK